MAFREESRESRKWEEDIYWTHFKYLYFSQFLYGDFLYQLAIPTKFANKLKDKLPETVSLKGPSGASWTVGLATNGDTLLFKHGWKEFVEDHSLEEDDILIFKYNGESRFDVLIFDQWSLCEREASYFVRQKEYKSATQTRRNVTDNSIEIVNDFTDDDAEGTSSKKCKHGETLMPTSSGLHSQAARRTQTKRGVDHVTSVQAKQNLRSSGPSARAAAENVYRNAKRRQTNRNAASCPQFVSHRRPVTEEEKEKALQMAHAAATDESFMVVMRPSHVYKGFYMTIPSKWVSSHLPPRHQHVTLRFEEDTWDARFFYRVCGAGINGGWKNFAIENNLEEFDVCLFELASATNDTIVFDVSIFRVVEDINPLTGETPPASSRGKKPSKYRRHKSN